MKTDKHFCMKNSFSRLLFAVSLFACMVMVALNLQAQKKEEKEQFKEIKLEKYDFDPLPVSVSEVSSISVISSVRDSSQIGFVQTGMTNRKKKAVPDKKELTDFLQSYVNREYKEIMKPGGLHLLWVVKDLRINERTFAMAEKAYVHLKADAWISKDSINYAFVTAFDTVLVTGGMDVTRKHGHNIATAFNLLLQRSMELEKAALTTTGQTLLSISKIEESDQKRFDIPALKDTLIREGAYVTFNEFLLNTPSIEHFNVVTNEWLQSTIYQVDSNGAKHAIIPWGICKKGELYKYYGWDLIPIEKIGYEYILSTYLGNIHRKNDGIFWGTLIGGIPGALAGAKSGKVYSVTAISYITKKQPEACLIDMETGKLSF